VLNTFLPRLTALGFGVETLINIAEVK
jgi:hypothetical protein